MVDFSQGTTYVGANSTFQAAAGAPGADPAGWYAFAPANNHTAPVAVSLADWSPEPAGKFGRITRQGDRLIYNGRPIKL